MSWCRWAFKRAGWQKTNIGVNENVNHWNLVKAASAPGNGSLEGCNNNREKAAIHYDFQKKKKPHKSTLPIILTTSHCSVHDQMWLDSTLLWTYTWKNIQTTATFMTIENQIKMLFLRDLLWMYHAYLSLTVYDLLNSSCQNNSQFLFSCSMTTLHSLHYFCEHFYGFSG